MDLISLLFIITTGVIMGTLIHDLAILFTFFYFQRSLNLLV
jgi:hypothetical protein